MNTRFPAACAVISRNYLSDGRVVASSYLQHHPGARFYLLIVDGLPGDIEAGPGIHVISPEELNLPYWSELTFKYSPTELCCALKPTLLNLLITKYDEEQVIYFDSDILVLQRLDEIIDRLPSADIMVTPHLSKPIPNDGMTPSEQDILVAGAHNLGFIAVRRSEPVFAFLQWWESRLRDGGFIEFSQGLLTDQRWIDLAPSLFPVTQLKDETYNVAYWNIHSRPVGRMGDTFVIHGSDPIAFFHFSGFDPAKPAIFSKHQNRTKIEPGSALADLLQLYVNLQMRNGFAGCRSWAYGFARFDNGVAISAPMRRAFSQLNQTRRDAFGNPFRTTGNSFLHWATRPDTLGGESSPFLRSLYEMRPDLAAAFRDVNGKDREAFLQWAATHGASEYKFDATAMRVTRAGRTSTGNAVSGGLKCSIIIPVFNKASLTRTCIDTVLATLPTDFDVEIIVSNDGSTDETAAVLNSYGSRVRTVAHSTNEGFADACNDGAAATNGEYLVFLNNDTVPQSGWLDALVRYADGHPEAAVVGSKLLFPNGSIQHAGMVICDDREPRHIYTGFPSDHPLVNRSRRYQAVTGACFLIRRADFEQANGFDAGFHNGYEDVDLCLRLGEAGREVHYCHESVAFHFESATREESKSRDGVRNRELYRERWGGRVRSDEFDFYLQDELFKVEHRAIYPLALSISPALATVNGLERERLADRLIQARSNQVMGLLRDNIRLNVYAREADFRLNELRTNGQKKSHVDQQRSDPLQFREPWIISRGENLWLEKQTTGRLISIILPVKNGAAKLRKLLPMILSQKIHDLVELIAIDSASTDESVELLKSANATVIGIDPRTFNHGLTRNLATRYARGAIYVFVNQSTLPADEHWLANLVRPFDSAPKLAGVCSRMLPRPDADYLSAKDISNNINATAERVVAAITDDTAYKSLNPENLRRFVNFHSLSAAIRAEVFQRIPFRELNFAEDLMWGKDVLEAGYHIQYEPSSVALHSHNYSVLDIFRRNFDDGAACRKIVGRTFSENDIAPAIMHEVLSDCRYLKEECHLEGEELDHWKLISVMRRSAQIFGHWIGVNYDRADGLAEGLASILSITEQIKAGARTEQLEEFVKIARSPG